MLLNFNLQKDFEEIEWNADEKNIKKNPDDY